MNAKEISEKLKVDKVAVFSDDITVVGMDSDFAAKLKEMIDVLIPAERFQGYLAVDGEYVVFKGDESGCVLVILEEERVKWCLRKLGEDLDGS